MSLCSHQGCGVGLSSDVDINLFLEEDPHHLLQYGDQASRPPSLLSLDTEGRVLRWVNTHCSNNVF